MDCKLPIKGKHYAHGVAIRYLKRSRSKHKRAEQLQSEVYSLLDCNARNKCRLSRFLGVDHDRRYIYIYIQADMWERTVSCFSMLNCVFIQMLVHFNLYMCWFSQYMGLVVTDQGPTNTAACRGYSPMGQAGSQISSNMQSSHPSQIYSR